MKCVDCDHRYCEFCNAGDKYQKKAKANVVTNFERIKAMSVEETARENVYFIPECKYAHYTGLSGEYRKTSAEVIRDNIKYLESEVQEDD